MLERVATVQDITIYPIKSCHGVKVKDCQVDNLGIQYDRRFMIIYANNNHFVTQRKCTSLNFLCSTIDQVNNTLTLSAKGQESISIPLQQDVSKLPKRNVQLWGDNLIVYDVGDEAGEWITEFLSNHKQHDCKNNRSIDGPLKENDIIEPLRLVTLDDPKNGVYSRPAHPQLKGIHSSFTDYSPISFGFYASLQELNKGLVETGFCNGNQISIDRFRNNINISGTIPWEEDHWLVAKIGEVTVYIVQPVAKCPIPNIDQNTGEKDNWNGKGLTDYLKIYRRFSDEPKEGQFCCDVIPLTSGKISVGDRVEVLERIPQEYQKGPLAVEA